MPQLGFNFAPIAVKKIVGLEDLRDRSFAVDANNMLYQFLSVVRMADGTPLRDSTGAVTSHLAGLLFRTSRLVHEFGMEFIFVFDGRPPRLKQETLRLRRAVRERAQREWSEARIAGDYATAFSKAVMAASLTQKMVTDTMRLIDLMGLPHIQAPSEAEAQAAYMATRGDVWAANSRDYDSLLFGSPRLVRYLTISGREFLPSKGIARPLKPEIIELQAVLSKHRIAREQLIDLAILVGTDFNEGVSGIGPKKALALVREYGRIENLPDSVKGEIPPNYEEIRRIFLEPSVTAAYTLRPREPDTDGIMKFLCDEREFSEDRVKTALSRLIQNKRGTADLSRWF